jgi:hypothetical protein
MKTAQSKLREVQQSPSIELGKAIAKWGDHVEFFEMMGIVITGLTIVNVSSIDSCVLCGLFCVLYCVVFCVFVFTM